MSLYLNEKILKRTNINKYLSVLNIYYQELKELESPDLPPGERIIPTLFLSLNANYILFETPLFLGIY